MSRPEIGTLIPLWKKDGGGEPTPYVRPADWLPMPPLTEGQQKIVGLYAVWPHDSNFCAIRVQGKYTVDWGDGSTPEDFDGEEKAEHIFDYDSLSSDTECSRGYRQAIVTITPRDGDDLIVVEFGVKHDQVLPMSSACWLDVRAVGDKITALKFGPFDIENDDYWDEFCPSVMLEVFSLVGDNLIKDFAYMFMGCISLRFIAELDTSQGQHSIRMFIGCSSLQTVTLNMPNLESAGWMFEDCFSLQTVTLNMPNLESADYMFGYCFSLQTVTLDIPSLINAENMFIDCSSLQTVTLDMPSLINAENMFIDCSSLQTVTLNMPNLESADRMFGYCFSLQTVTLDMPNLESADYMFGYCFSLSSVILQDISVSFSVAFCCLSRQALVDLFDGLAEVDYEEIDITGNWGVDYLTPADIAIATNKGWEVYF